MKRLCSICGARESYRLRMVQHHISYNPPVTMVLCRHCHSIIHGLGLKGEEGPRFLRALIKTSEIWSGKPSTPRSILWWAICIWLNIGIEKGKIPRFSQILEMVDEAH